MKAYTLSLFVLMICSTKVVRECNADEKPNPSPECLKKDCPKYEVIYRKEVEIRSYSQALWASSTYNETSVLGTLGTGLRTLALYFNQDNDQKVTIQDNSAIALVEANNNVYTLNFYFPQKYQNGSLPLPKPNSPLIKAVKLPTKKYAAVTRGTDLGEDVIKGKIDVLKKSLQWTPYQRAAASAQFSVLLYNSAQLFTGNVFEILVWFD